MPTAEIMTDVKSGLVKSSRSQSLASTPRKNQQETNPLRTVTYRMSLPTSAPCGHIGRQVRLLSDTPGRSTIPIPGYPYALMLRLRVMQIVIGALTALLGTAACVEEQTRFTLSIGLVSGLLTMISAVASIGFFKNDHCRSDVALSTWILPEGSDTLKTDVVLLALWASSVISCIMMIGLSGIALTTSNNNVFIIGALEIGFGVLILFSIVGTTLLRVRYRILS